MKNGVHAKPKNEGALKTRFLRHGGIYRSDVSSLLVNLGRSTAFRSGPGQAIGHAGRKRALPIVRDEFRPAIPQRGARQHCPSPLHRHHQLKTIAASTGIIYHRTVNSLLTVCLTSGGNPSPSLVYAYVERKQIPHFRMMGRSIRFRLSELDRWRQQFHVNGGING